jgi:6-phosphofructo-2-kinase
MKRIRDRAGPDLGVLFIESICQDQHLLESNMRLKLSGPDYKDKDPVKSLADFKQRVTQYETTYKPIGEYEERHNMQFIQMIDVGRKVISHQIKGFLAAQTVYYLLNFNLSPRQIWITRHGESIDNLEGKIGGDSELSANGVKYAHALTRFIIFKRQEWENHQRAKELTAHFPPRSGDMTPPNPEYSTYDPRSDSDNSSLESHGHERSFCVWTSMLKRSIQTAQFFSEEQFDVKQMRMLDELNAGMMEGMTYEEIKKNFSQEYELRKRDKLQYRYPGAGGEGYLDIINRLRAVIVEVERMTDHVLLVGHRSIVRVLLAYFKGLRREEVADLDAPLGVLYCLEPVSRNSNPSCSQSALYTNTWL